MQFISPKLNRVGRPRNESMESKTLQAACTLQPIVPREVSAEELAIYNDLIEDYSVKAKSIRGSMM